MVDLKWETLELRDDWSDIWYSASFTQRGMGCQINHEKWTCRKQLHNLTQLICLKRSHPLHYWNNRLIGWCQEVGGEVIDKEIMRLLMCRSNWEVWNELCDAPLLCSGELKQFHFSIHKTELWLDEEKKSKIHFESHHELRKNYPTVQIVKL